MWPRSPVGTGKFEKPRLWCRGQDSVVHSRIASARAQGCSRGCMKCPPGSRTREMSGHQVCALWTPSSVDFAPKTQQVSQPRCEDIVVYGIVVRLRCFQYTPASIACAWPWRSIPCERADDSDVAEQWQTIKHIETRHNKVQTPSITRRGWDMGV